MNSLARDPAGQHQLRGFQHEFLDDYLASSVQFGIVHQVGAGQYSEEGLKMGDVTGSDVDENGVFCTTCEESRSRDELVSADLTGESEQEDM